MYTMGYANQPLMAEVLVKMVKEALRHPGEKPHAEPRK
jgi:hypothetical protein